MQHEIQLLLMHRADSKLRKAHGRKLPEAPRHPQAQIPPDNPKQHKHPQTPQHTPSRAQSLPDTPRIPQTRPDKPRHPETPPDTPRITPDTSRHPQDIPRTPPNTPRHPQTPPGHTQTPPDTPRHQFRLRKTQISVIGSPPSNLDCKKPRFQLSDRPRPI